MKYKRIAAALTLGVVMLAGGMIAIEAATYHNEVLADSPSAYWPLDETSGTLAEDASGHGKTATYGGGATLGADGATRHHYRENTFGNQSSLRLCLIGKFGFSKPQ